MIHLFVLSLLCGLHMIEADDTECKVTPDSTGKHDRMCDDGKHGECVGESYKSPPAQDIEACAKKCFKALKCQGFEYDLHHGSAEDTTSCLLFSNLTGVRATDESLNQTRHECYKTKPRPDPYGPPCSSDTDLFSGVYDRLCDGAHSGGCYPKSNMYLAELELNEPSLCAAECDKYKQCAGFQFEHIKSEDFGYCWLEVNDPQLLSEGKDGVYTQKEGTEGNFAHTKDDYNECYIRKNYTTLTLDGNFEEVVQDKTAFLESCSSYFMPVRCTDVVAGSIVITLLGRSSQLIEALQAVKVDNFLLSLQTTTTTTAIMPTTTTPTPDASGCYDTPGWTSKEGDDCSKFRVNCADGGWQALGKAHYDTFANSDGVSPADACCACGKGKSAAPMTEPAAQESTDAAAQESTDAAANIITGWYPMTIAIALLMMK